MNKLLITGFSNVTSEGVSLQFSEPVQMHKPYGISTMEIWVSWDKIGQALFPDEYSTESDVETLRKLRSDLLTKKAGM